MKANLSKKPTTIASVKKAVSILDLFIENQRPLGVKEISKNLDLNFSTAHHLVRTLTLAGYLKQEKETKKYGLGVKTLQLGVASQVFFQQVVEKAKPILKELVSRVNEDVNLAILDNNDIIYIGKESSNHAMRIFTRLGAKAPLYCTGVGKVFLAEKKMEELKQYFEEEQIVSKTENTLTTWNSFLNDIRKAKKDGFALDREEMEEGVACIAVPIKNYEGEVKAALSVSGLASRVLGNKDYLKEELLSSAKALSIELGRGVSPEVEEVQGISKDQGNNKDTKKNDPIGIFDSGMGGFSVLKPLLKKLPNESILYFGDTERRPYGPKPLSTVRKYVLEICSYLVNMNAKLIVIACNTASVAGEREAKQTYPHIPVIGMVGAGVNGVLRRTVSKKIAVLGTKCTVESGVFQKQFFNLDPLIKTYPVATEDLLRMAELGGESAGFSREEMISLAQDAICPVLEEGVDTILLACTDFPCIMDILEEVVNRQAVMIDPAPEVAVQVEKLLKDNNLKKDEELSSELLFFISGEDVNEFNSFGKEYLKIDISASQIDLT